MKDKNSTLFHDQSFIFLKASKHQKKYISDSTYSIVSPNGRSFERTFELLAHNMNSGKLLIKEKVVYGADKYEKVYLLSEEGKTEKFREKEI